jgi:ribonuclease HII
MLTLRTCPRLARLDNDRRRRHGALLIGGVDEAGRGPLAGPVVAACVVLAPGTRLPGLDDSKKLDREQREALAPLILERAVAWGLGWATAAEIDRINVLQATLRAAGRAMRLLAVAPQYLLTDYLNLPDPPCPIEPLVKGDARSQAIAAASILAKVARDRIMTALDPEYPSYGFAEHKGYGTPAHWAALRAHGPSTLHRLSFRGVLPEPFFGAETESVTLVRCRSHAALNGRPRSPSFDAPGCDWLHLLAADPTALTPHPFLPEAEWQPETLASV